MTFNIHFFNFLFSRKKNPVWGKCTYITKAVLNNHRKKEHDLGLYQHPP